MATEPNMEVAKIAPIQKSNPKAQYPSFPILIGERPLLLSKTVEGSAMVTNFRFCMCERRSFINVPLMMVGELVVAEAYCWLKLGCKDGATYSCTFATVEDCQACVNLLRQRTGVPRSPDDLFAYTFYTMAQKRSGEGSLTVAEKEQINLCVKDAFDKFTYTFGKEVVRQGFDTNRRKIWRMSQANHQFEFCATYPKDHILPVTIDDDELRRSLDFRAMKRFPSVVWRDKNLGVVLIRSSQPMSSFLGLSYFSNHADVSLLEKIVDACRREREAIEEDHQRQSGPALISPQSQGTATGGGSTDGAGGEEEEEGAQGSLVAVDQGSGASNGASNAGQSLEPSAPTDAGKLAIVDCRSVAGIWGNSLKGGGTEDEAVYKCSIIHLDLANIHTVRDSFNKLRALCNSYAEGSYLKSLSGCMWLTYIAALLRGANIVVDLMQVKRRPVLVHCSDGWDRTSQICSLSELMMDKYYRTLEGFQVLVEREWLQFGHKFAERGGHDPNCSDANQASPIFLQFLDTVYQLTLQYPAEFQFNEAYLVKLLKHSQACLFGNFLHNCERERVEAQPTGSVWSLLRPEKPQFVNLLYKPTHEILTAKYGEHDIVLWKNVYMAGLSPWLHPSQTDFHMDSSLMGSAGDDAGNTAAEGIPRSKSMDDLGRANADSGRRNSDPMVVANLECAASAPTPGLATAAGDTHDTSSSSAELLHYPDELQPGRAKPAEDGDVKEGTPSTPDVSTGSSGQDGDGPSTLQAASSKDVNVDHHTGEGENSSSAPDTSATLCGDAAVPVSGATGQQPQADIDTTADNASAEAGLPSECEDLFPEGGSVAQNLIPSSSSVFSGVDHVEEVDVIHEERSVGEASTSEVARLPTPGRTLTDPTVPGPSDPAVTQPTLELSPSSTSSSSMPVAATSSSLLPLGRVSPGGDAGSTDNVTRVSHVSQAAPPSPLSSPSSPSSSAHNGRFASSSLLAERLALTGDAASHSTPASSGGVSQTLDVCYSNGKSSPGPDPYHPQHSRSMDDVNDLTAKLKAGVLLDTSRKANGITAGSHGKGAASSPLSKPVHHMDAAAIPQATKHSHSHRHQPGVFNGAGEEELSRSVAHALTESTDTLVDQPVGGGRKISEGSTGSSKLLSASAGGAAAFGPSSISPSSSYSSPSLLTASPQRKESTSPQTAQQHCRRARAASGASRDLSVSPCNTCTGAWADTGRLRNPSGGGEMVRRWIGATVATSTSDISDSFVGKVGNNSAAMMERGPSVRQHLDVDGLTLFCDERQDLLAELVAEKDRKIMELENRLHQAEQIIRANRERQQQQQQQCAPSSSHLGGHTGGFEDLRMTEVEGGEPSSLGALSNAASDGSWDLIEKSEEKIVTWMPDAVVTHCAGCDCLFWMANRKHHCRNCGKVFCWECSNFLAPVPHQHLNKPQRVCSRCHSDLMQLSPGASSDGRIPTLVADG